MTELSQATWRKAELSVHNGGCLEVASLPAGVGVRDSKTPQAGAHVVGREYFGAFLEDAKSGRFDI
jgi:hypothetical protein